MSHFKGIAESPTILRVLDQARQFAPFPRPILIRGERGVGKELIARFIHDNSDRKDRAFVPINCAAFNDELVHAEIYGHEKGAFTGATETRIGRLEQADGGTLFFDEIGSMSLPFQEMILRVIEYQEFRRIRGTQKIKVDVRVVSATNANLEELMEENLFRRDLYDRLTFAELNVPPLRRRRKDIPPLIVHFVQSLQEEMPNLPEKTFGSATVQAMLDYYWPGNVRELRNIVERLYLYSAGIVIKPDDLPPQISGSEITGDSFHDKVEQYKQQLILSTLSDCNGNQRQAADELRMTYDQFRHFYRKFTSIQSVYSS